MSNCWVSVWFKRLIVLALGAAGLYAMSEKNRYSNSTLLVAGLIVTLLAIVVFRLRR